MTAKIFGTGVDIIEVPRIEQALDRWGNTFMERIFTKAEIRFARKMRIPGPHLAARFAAKEAVRKAFGDTWDDGASWKSVEVVTRPSGRPTIRLHGPAKAIRDREGVTEIWVSLSHTRSWAVASVVMERAGRLHWPP